jgi:DNA repair exonuclease SbcCD nuclease subunit
MARRLRILLLADAGVPVVLVPGNHERSAIPHPLLARHPGLLIFQRPQTFVLCRAGLRIALAGFAHQRQVRRSFRRQLAATGWQQQPTDIRLLCLHQAVEGARVGPRDFTFTGSDDVIRAAELPAGFAAVLAGHIHRHQVLDRNPDGRRLACCLRPPQTPNWGSLVDVGDPIQSSGHQQPSMMILLNLSSSLGLCSTQ